MGSVKIDLSTKEKRWNDNYPLDKPYGVYALFSNIHYIREMRFLKGDFDACILLIDLDIAIAEADLTKRQREVLYWVFEKDLTQQEVAAKLGISQQAVSDHINSAIRKIAFINRLGELKEVQR